MESLDFCLPDFVRIAWCSETARSVWGARLNQIRHAWRQVEWLSVAHGLRRCAVLNVSAEEFIQSAGEWAHRRLNCLPLSLESAGQYTYNNRSYPAVNGKPFVFRVVIGRVQDTADFLAAWEAEDHAAMGALLGYPACCTDFFEQTWGALGLCDTTWAQAAATVVLGSDQQCEIEIRGLPQANLLWRWAGLRLAPHLPCRYDCEGTRALGLALHNLACNLGFDQEFTWLDEILSWPVEWSALHGIAEVKTPILRLSTVTDATPYKYTVRWLGSAYPEEGARGVGFPYRPALRWKKASHSRAFVSAQPDWYAADNGFASEAAMQAAHKPLLALLSEATPLGGRVLDLGCGNGALLSQFIAMRPDIQAYGLDLRPTHIAHARRLFPAALSDHFAFGDLFASTWPWDGGRQYDLALLMPGRLIEAGAEQAASLRLRLAAQVGQVLVYAYGDWLNRPGGLPGLSVEAGLELTGPLWQGCAALARSLPV